MTKMIALVDLKMAHTKPNREHAGGFGAHMAAQGAAGRLVQRLKEHLVELPVTSLGFSTVLLRNAGHQVVLTQGHVSALQATPDIVLVATSMACHDHEIAYAEEAARAHPQAKVGFFGALPTVRPEIFEPHGDFVIKGELESAILGFIDGKHDFQGIVEAGVVVDPYRLPIPDWEGFNVRRFSYFPLLHKRPLLPIQSARGCPYGCDYCSYMPVQGSCFRPRDPKSIAEEMERGVELHGARSFLFRDICFTLDHGHVRAILEGIRKRGLNVEWACETRVDRLDEDLIDEMFEVGFRGVNVGIETPDEDILRKSGKRPPVQEQQLRILDYLRVKRIRVNAFYMLGLPGDTPESMQRTIAFARQVNTIGAQFCIMTPFPGTPMYEQVKNDLLTNDFRQFDEYHSVVDINSSTPTQVEQALSQAYRYYFRSDWLAAHLPAIATRLASNLFFMSGAGRRP